MRTTNEYLDQRNQLSPYYLIPENKDSFTYLLGGKSRIKSDNREEEPGWWYKARVLPYLQQP